MTPRPRSFDETEALDRAKHLFWSKGFEATSMQNLVDHMTIGRQSLYNTFGDKRSLYLRALKRFDAEHHDPAIQALESDSRGLPTIRGFLSTVVDELVGQDERRADFLMNALMELAPRDAAVSELGAQHRAKLVHAFSQALGRARELGQVNGELAIVSTARLLAHTTMGLGLTWKSGASAEELRGVVDAALAPLEGAAQSSTASSSTSFAPAPTA